MKRLLSMVAGGLVCLEALGGANAQPEQAGAPGCTTAWQEADLDGNGELTAEEVEQAVEPVGSSPEADAAADSETDQTQADPGAVPVANFETIDSDGNGVVTEAEWEACGGTDAPADGG